MVFIIVGVLYIKPGNWVPFTTYGVSGLLASGAAEFFTFVGFDILATSAEEVKDPQSNLPIGIIVSLIIVTANSTVRIFHISK